MAASAFIAIRSRHIGYFRADFSLPNGDILIIVHHMEIFSATLDAAFHALADPTRRAVVNRLMVGPAPVKELAEPFSMGLPAFLKHLKVLEDSGLIASEKSGRTRTCRVKIERLAEAETWLSQQRELWQGRTDRLAHYVETQMSRENENDG
ncbi:ArsR/SmtB family transcription factor [Aliihoeflea sp. PC F10.4]